MATVKSWSTRFLLMGKIALEFKKNITHWLKEITLPTEDEIISKADTSARNPLEHENNASVYSDYYNSFIQGAEYILNLLKSQK